MVTSLPLITVYKNLSSLSYFNDHKIRSLITTVSPKKFLGFAVAVAAVDRRRRRRRRRRRASPPPSSVAAAVAVDSPMRGVDDSPHRRVGESAF